MIAMDLPSTPAAEVPALRYVALGDSYTIGTAVAQADRWPDRLVAALAGDRSRPALALVANLGVNGATSGDVVARQLPRLGDLAPDFVTLLVGVNDVVQGVPEARYRMNVETILADLLVRLAIDRIVAITTPDYTVTPAGADYGDPDEQRAGIVRNNEILTELATARGLAVVDIFDLSGRAASERSLVASDGLHPSGTQYALWVERIAPIVGRLLDGR
jgi:acyl-CoA thioesterase-1